MDVHEPYMPERRYVDMVDPSISIDQDQMYALFENTLLKRDVSDPAGVSMLKRLYDVHVRETDSYVESFFKSMDTLGLLKDTAFVITSDHGDEFNEHGGLSHDDKLYAELIDIPLLIYGTGENSLCGDVVSSVDIPPTILDLFGDGPCPSFQGRSLLPPGKRSGRGAFGEAINQKSIKGGDMGKDSYFHRVGDMKLIYHADTGQSELYNLASDPHEQNNIAGDNAETGKLMLELKPRVRRWTSHE
jgi:arylsulfatase A-like enzyme